jgi:hypothetical protein
VNRAEVARLLTLAGGYDGRQVAETEVRAWHEVLARYEYETTSEAVVEHYTHQTKRLMPADVVRYCRARGNEAAERHRELPRIGIGTGIPKNVRALLASVKATYVVEDDSGEVLWRGPAEQLRAIVLDCPSARERLTLPPLSHSKPERWNGYVPSRLWGGRYEKYAHNASATRKQLIEVVKIALAPKAIAA